MLSVGVNDEHEYLFAIADTGIGIENTEFENIFKPFYQAGSAQTGKHRGTGLGLSLTKELVAMHGGSIWVESDGLGKGCRFCFTIPQEITRD